jgi:predicted regulator of Ras-like GTPase activity (Roadblock/LC7/MglB family)
VNKVADNRTEKIVAKLEELQASSPSIQGAEIVSVDGLPIASVLRGNADEERLAAMSAAMLSLGERISAELRRGTLEQVYIKGEDGYVFLTAVGEEAVLTVMASKDVKLGLVFLDMRRAIPELAALI